MNNRLAKLHVFTSVAFGVAVLAQGFAHWQCHDPLRLFSFIAAAVFGAVLKVRLPGLSGAISVSSLFVLVGIVNLSFPETLLVGAISMLVQCTWRTERRPRAVQVIFNICVLASAIGTSTFIFERSRGYLAEPFSLGVLALAYFCANTFPVAVVIALTEGKSIPSVWRGYHWMLPYYIVGCSVAWLIGTVPSSIQWELPIICLPIVYLVHRSNRTHTAQMEQANKHVMEMNALHLRTIEALALAIDAKDHTTHDHLQRVQTYAVEVGKDLGLSAVELDALRAAAVLHDIGKLAVPESIISKPGKLTRAEFEKMKIHPVVGAEILERVDFPYPVVPIVRAHHEKWNGSGYPYGLKGTEIPIGARILAAVDCLDALASDRQYRRALPLDEAMAKVASEAGTSFDPEVVGALQARYRELESLAKSIRPEQAPSLSVDLQITRGSAPATGFEAEPLTRAGSPVIRRPRALQRDERSVEESLAVLALRIEKHVEHDALAVFAVENDGVRCKFATGDDRRQLSPLCVPPGSGLSGWVAETAKPILNADPAVEPGYSRAGVTTLASALALPLEDSGRIIGVLALYRKERDAFAADELVSLLPHCPAVAALLVAIDESRSEQKDPALIDVLAHSA